MLLTLCIALMAPSQSRYGVAAQLMTEEECTADSSRSTLTLSTFVTRIFACELPEGDGALMEERARRENTTQRFTRVVVNTHERRGCCETGGLLCACVCMCVCVFYVWRTLCT